MNTTLTKTTRFNSRTVQLLALGALAVASAFGLLPAEAATLMPLLWMTVDASGGDAAPASGGAAPAAAPTDAPAAGGGSPAAGGAVTPTEPKQPPLSRGARAAEKAAARIKANTPTSTDSQQAPGGGTPAAGTSTELKPGEAGKAADPAGTTADGKGKAAEAASASASTVTVPQDWPDEDRNDFAKLPDDGKRLVLGIQKRMQAGLTRATTQLADQSKTHQEAITIGKQFSADPKATIAELAKRANLEVFFERPTAEDRPSEDVLNDPVKYAKWIADKAVRDATQAIDARNSKAEAEKAKAAEAEGVQKASAALQQEFAAAAQAHTDFADHKAKVVAVLQRAQGGLTTEEAYQLVTYPTLIERVNEGEKAKRELVTLKADIERKAKDATRLPAGGLSPGGASGEDKFLSRGALAMKRAEAKRATRSAAG